MKKPIVRKLRCAVYTRKSTEEGLEQDYNSIDAQRDAGQAYIASQRHEGWIPVATDYDDPAYDAFWEAAVALDLPLSFHILTTAAERRRGPKINSFLAIIRGCQDIMSTMIFGGVFARYPALKVACVEADAGWAPHFMYRMDHAYKRHRYWMKCAEMKKLPSEYMSDLKLSVSRLNFSGAEYSGVPHTSWPYSLSLSASRAAWPGVQPTPRWEIVGGSATLNMHDYVVMKNAIVHVKDVPVFYLPLLYYPIQEDARATGVLMPLYGSSLAAGSSISNAFFWAINRSQDATFGHDWYSRAGQGVTGEYRYNCGGGSDGTVTTHFLDQKAIVNTNGPGSAASRSYQVVGFANQMLPGRLRARFTADYFSSLSVNQQFSTDVYAASRNQRNFGGNVVGAWRTFSLNGTFDRREFFSSLTDSWVQGSAPRISLARNERPLFKNSPIYFSANGEFVRIDRFTESSGVKSNDTGVTRFDVTPTIRYPFKKWQWFTVNSSLSWRDTYYTRSLTVNSDGTQGPVIDDPLNRRYYEVSANAIGPVFNRIFDTRDSGYAERWKHSIEPVVNIQRRSAVDAFNKIIQNDGSDLVVGNTTNIRYGLNNRLYAKRRSQNGRPAMSQEVLALEILQTYYTSPSASQYDTTFQTGYGVGKPSNFSPIQVNLRATPTTALNATVRAEVDSKYKTLRTVGANSTLNISNRVQSTIGWTKRFYIPELQGFNDRAYLDHSLNVQNNVHTADNRIGVIHTFNYDILHGGMLQQRVSAFYNAQCCGIAMEYQTYNYAGFGSSYPPVRRFFLSFTLAGLGNFSPFNGAMSGMPR